MSGGPITRVLDSLYQVTGTQPQRNGRGWISRCPGHDDRRPSLSIAEGRDGCVLLTCHAGCTLDAICDALGIKKFELFPDRGDGYTPIAKACPNRGVTNYPTADDAVAALERRLGTRSALWIYCNAAGEQVGAVVRWDRPDGKDIRPIARRGSRWVIGAMPSPRPLYRLPDLAGARRVYLTEGEKCADVLRALGLNATTSAGGAKAARKTDWTPLAGKEVVLMPDNDDAGARYADDVASILTTLTPAAAVKIVELPGLAPAGDAVDYIKSCRDAGRSDVEIRTDIEALVDTATSVEPVCPTSTSEPYTPFPCDALPDVVRRFVVDGAEAMGCDPCFIALHALAVLASAIGNTTRVQLKKSWSEPALLWCMVVARSGTMKTPAMKYVMRPLLDLQRSAMSEHKTASDDYRIALTKFEAELAAWKSERLGDPPLRPEPPSPKRLVVADSTSEALAAILEKNPRGILAAMPELGALVGSFGRYSRGRTADMSAWQSMHDADTLIVDRKTSEKPTIFVPYAAVSVTGTIQPATLERAFDPQLREAGLLARFLLAIPPTSPALWTDADVPDDVRDGFASVIKALLAIPLMQDNNGDPSPRDIPLVADAQPVYMAWHDQHVRQTADLDGDLAAAYAKMKGGCARLALVIHMAALASGDTDTDPPPISVSVVRSAIRLAEWFKSQARRAYGRFRETDEERERRELVEWIERRGGTTTVRELTHSGPHRFRNATDLAQTTLNDLTGAGHGDWEYPPPSPKGGRPTKRFRLNTSGTVTETPIDTTESAGFGLDATADAGDKRGEL